MRVQRALVVGFVAALAAERAQAQLLPAQVHPLKLPAGVPAAGDLDGDGRLDIAVANKATGTIAVLPAGEHFEFGTPVEWPAVQKPLGAAIADIDDDGLPDLLGAGQPGGDIAVLRGLGSFSFAPPVLWSMAADARDFLVEDFDGDGREDLLAVGHASPDLVLRLGDGSGGFGMPQSFAGASQAVDLVAVDLDVDGDLDVLSAHNLPFSGPTLQAHVNDGAGSLATTVDWSGPAPFWTVATGDIDADGKPDVAGLGSTASWAAGDGMGSFGPAIWITAPFLVGGTYNLAMADMQGDGWLDLVATGDAEYVGNPFVEALPGLGGGNFGPFAGSRAITGSVSVADFDADTRPDVVIAGPEGVLALRGQGDGTFETVEHLYPHGLYVYPVGGATLADLNGDGWPDAALSSADRGIWWHLADGAGWFGPNSVLDLGSFTSSPFDVRACDLAADGDQDLVVLDQGHASIWTLLGDGAGALAVGAELQLPGKPMALRLADITGDGLLDALLAREGGVGVGAAMFSLLPQLPEGTLAAPQSLPLKPKPKDLDVADLDADGDLDVVVGTEGSTWSRLAVLRNDGNGILTEVSLVEAGTQLTSLALADFDADGLVDAVVAGPQLLLLDGQAGDTFAAPDVIDATPLFILDVTAGDIDGDGSPDLALAHQFSHVSVRFNDGAAGFAEVSLHPSLDFPVEVLVQDFDLDGATDVLVADYNFDKGVESGLTILRNRSASWAWTDLGHALAGTGLPHLAGTGALTADTQLSVSLTGAAPLAPAVLFAGLSALLAPFKGGVFVPQPQFAVPFEVTDSMGTIEKTGTCPPGLPKGFTVLFQYWIADVAGPQGWSASNGLECEAP